MSSLKPGDWVERQSNSKTTDIKLVVAVRGEDVWYANKLSDHGVAPTIIPARRFDLCLIHGCKGFDDYKYIKVVNKADFEAIHNGRTVMEAGDYPRAKGDMILVRCEEYHELYPISVRVTYADDDYICFEKIDEGD